LKKYHHSEKKKLRVYEFFRLHSIKGISFPNLFASIFGINYRYLAYKHNQSIYTYHKKKGYVTAVSSDTCLDSIIFEKRNKKAYKFSDPKAPDHMFYQFSCDYNSMPEKDPFNYGN